MSGRRLGYTAAFKLKVTDFAEKSGNHSAQRQFEKQVQYWRKKKDEHLRQVNRSKLKSSHTGLIWRTS